jgi:hypothetical protein
MVLPTTSFLKATFAPIFELIDAAGEDVVIRENTAPNTFTNHPAVKAKPKPMTMEDLKDGSPAKQGDLFLIVRADAFPVARRLEQKDRVHFRGRDYAVINDDANQYSIGGTVYARVLHVRG